MRRAHGAASLAAYAAVALLIACSGHSGIGELVTTASSDGTANRAVEELRRGHPFTSTPIQHVVVIIQENRSFDNLFNGYPGANTVQTGIAIPVGPAGTPIPGATPTSVPLQPLTLADPWDIPHGLGQFTKSYDNGLMDGYSTETTRCYSLGCQTPNPATYPAYSYVPQSETVPYWTMAQQYVLADNMFASNIDASFVAHQYLIAGWAKHAVNYPPGNSWGCDNPKKVSTITKNRKLGPPESACFTYNTLATALEAKGYDWRYYAAAPGADGYFWSAFDAIDQVRNGPEWTQKVISPPKQVLIDAAAGNLVVGVTWVTPVLQNSDHASSGTTTGPAWVASVVNAIGENPALWNTTAIFILWDDWGGWYDHVMPPTLDYDGLGIRVPMIVVSPYAKQGYVTHVQYEFGSILKFVESDFGLKPVAPTTCCHGMKSSERRANDPTTDAFNFQATPRPFIPIPSSLNREYFLHQPQDTRPPDNE